MWFDDRDDLEDELDEDEMGEDTEEEPGTLQCYPHAREIFGEIIICSHRED